MRASGRELRATADDLVFGIGGERQACANAGGPHALDDELSFASFRIGVVVAVFGDERIRGVRRLEENLRGVWNFMSTAIGSVSFGSFALSPRMATKVIS